MTHYIPQKLIFVLLCAFATHAVELIEQEPESLIAIDELFSPQPLELIYPPETTSNLLIPQTISPIELDFPQPTKHPKSLVLAVGLSTLCPGLGHTYLGDLKTAGGLFGTTGLSIGSATAFYKNNQALSTSVATALNTWLYGIYAAYRDVRIYNGQEGFAYRMPTDSLADLAYAPFNIHVLKKPEVWGGVLGAFVLACGVSYLAFHKHVSKHASHSISKALTPAIALPVGIGEESFYHGFVQTSLSESLTPAGGIVLSSLLFGASHISNGLAMEPESRSGYYKFMLPFITLIGAYNGWLTYKNNSLQSSVAMHTWYDFILLSLASVATQSITSQTEFAIDLPF